MSLNPLSSALSAPATPNPNANRADKPADDGAPSEAAPAPFAKALQRARQTPAPKGEASNPALNPKAANLPERDRSTKEMAPATEEGEDVPAVATTEPQGVITAPVLAPVLATAAPAPITADALLQAALAASTGVAAASAEGTRQTAQETDGVAQALLPGEAPLGSEGKPQRAKPTWAAQDPSAGTTEQRGFGPREGEDVKAQWQAVLGREAGPAAQAPGASTPQAAVAAAAQTAQASAGTALPTFETLVQAPLQAQVGRPEFAPALGNQITTFVREGIRQAELTLNPAEMGPVTVNIALQGQHAQVDFIAAHAATRVALEQSLPALASALHQAGFTLTGGGVSDQRPRGQRSGNQEDARAHRDRLEPIGNTGPRTGAAARRSQGLLDMFA